jgi:hypothetical protein
VADYQFEGWSHGYAVRPDDQQFLMLKMFDLPNELALVLNFFEELKQRVGK